MIQGKLPGDDPAYDEKNNQVKSIIICTMSASLLGQLIRAESQKGLVSKKDLPVPRKFLSKASGNALVTTITLFINFRIRNFDSLRAFLERLHFPWARILYNIPKQSDKL